MRKEHRQLVQWIKEEFEGRVVIEEISFGRHINLHLRHVASQVPRKMPLGGYKNYSDPRAGLNFKADLRRWVSCLEMQQTLSDKKERRQVLGLPA